MGKIFDCVPLRKFVAGERVWYGHKDSPGAADTARVEGEPD